MFGLRDPHFKINVNIKTHNKMEEIFYCSQDEKSIRTQKFHSFFFLIRLLHGQITADFKIISRQFLYDR